LTVFLLEEIRNLGKYFFDVDLQNRHWMQMFSNSMMKSGCEIILKQLNFSSREEFSGKKVLSVGCQKIF